jgi:23S rRNA (uracil1939-C5)-methyltransferase
VSPPPRPGRDNRSRNRGKKHARRRPEKVDPLVGECFEVEITAVGGKGDGLAASGDYRFYVPYAAPGDRARIRVEARKGDGYSARIEELLEPGPHRAHPPCPYYGECGGCALQHVDQSFISDWKRQQVVEAFRRQGLAPDVGDLLAPPVGTRRRATFEFENRHGKIAIGFNARQSHQIVSINSCPLLIPELNKIIAPLAALLPSIADTGERGDIVINYVEGRADIVFLLQGQLSLKRLEALSQFAQTHDIARLSRLRKGESPELLVNRRTVAARFGGVSVPLPPGTFLQPSAEGEALLVAEVIKGLSKCLSKKSRVADLFSGCGTFSFPLAEHALVKAVEAASSMTDCLSAAAGQASLGGRLTAETRDLDRRPLLGKELNAFDAVVFDPPRAGAREQAEALAASTVARVIAVSCNPTTLARDVRILIDGGYRLDGVTPIDQFPYAPHLEAIAFLSR